MTAIATITRDLLAPDGPGSRVGDEWWLPQLWNPDNTARRPAFKPGHELKVVYGTLVDDDGETYYHFKIEHDSDEERFDEMLERLYDWGMYDSGTTMLYLDGDLVIG